MKPNGAKVFVGQKVFKGYSTIRLGLVVDAVQELAISF